MNKFLLLLVIVAAVVLLVLMAIAFKNAVDSTAVNASPLIGSLFF